ncbi:MAG: hypothetical protein KC505_04230 [Myxococcales bacterium]|nr:hypothetical protein [Myxococcales bacterium]USN50212.1 MAG: hypothetical protein H6731_08060 [Myxococcales bacterium]
MLSLLPQSKRSNYLKAFSFVALASSIGFSQPVNKTVARDSAYAQILFSRGDYFSTVLLLEKKTNYSLNEQFILAESLFYLGRYAEAESIYKKLVGMFAQEASTIHLRFFQIKLLQGDTKNAIHQYNEYKKNHKRTPAVMDYALGKALYDENYENKAIELLNLIPKGNEFYIRAQYLIGASYVDKKDFQKSIEIFSQIGNQPAISTEDYSIKPMALIALARVYVSSDQINLALDTYEKVPLIGPVGETAISELIRTLVLRSEMASLGKGIYAQMNQKERYKIAQQAIGRALSALERYQKTTVIDWRKPKLHTWMAFLYVKSKRYDEGRLAYAQLIEHFRPVYQNLVSQKGQGLIWPSLMLNFSSQKSLVNEIFPGVPESLLKGVPEIFEIRALKLSIEESHARLNELVALAKKNRENISELVRAQREQGMLEQEYQLMVKNQQSHINLRVAQLINKVLAQAEFQRAELAQEEMHDLKTQIKSNSEYQTKKINEFERDLSLLDEGGAL